MQISKLKTIANLSLNDILPVLDIDGGISGKPILGKTPVASIVDLIPIPQSSSNNGISIPTTIKTVAESGDFFIGIGVDGIPYKISKQNLLAGLSSGSSSSTTQKTILLLHGATIADSSASAQSIDNLGSVVTSTAQSKFDGSSLYFSGSSRLKISSSLFVFNDDFCIQGFVRWQQTSFNGEPGIFQLSSVPGGLQPGYSNSLGIGVVPSGGSNKYFMIANNTTYGGSIAVTTGNFDYVALKRETRVVLGVNKKITSLWVNGVEAVSIEDLTNYTGQELCLGGYYSTAYLGNFYLDEFRISSESKDVSVVPVSPFS